MGDFFEMFYDDAENAAPVMGIALTSRNKNSEEKTPMCGVPFHSVGPQINKLLKAGFKVAICDQLEEASQAKGLVRRGDRKSTRLNSSHQIISYAVFCLKKKTTNNTQPTPTKSALPTEQPES